MWAFFCFLLNVSNDLKFCWISALNCIEKFVSWNYCVEAFIVETSKQHNSFGKTFFIIFKAPRGVRKWCQLSTFQASQLEVFNFSIDIIFERSQRRRREGEKNNNIFTFLSRKVLNSRTMENESTNRGMGDIGVNSRVADGTIWGTRRHDSYLNTVDHLQLKSYNLVTFFDTQVLTIAPPLSPLQLQKRNWDKFCHSIKHSFFGHETL